MSNSNGVITAPVSIADVKQALGLASNDLGTLCTSGKINKWARYKPVSLPVLFVNDTFDKSTNLWGETDQNKGWHRPWFYGHSAIPSFEIPIISELNELGENGVQKETAVWKYNKPEGESYSPYRITDFCGYNHNASIPIHVAMSSKIEINTIFSAAISDTYTNKAHGEWEFSDILKIIDDNADVYAGITIWNRTRGVIVSYVKETSLVDDVDAGIFILDPSDSSAISLGGFGHTIRNNDIIDVYLYLSTSPGETGESLISKYSPLADNDLTCYRRYIAGYRMVVVQVLYGCDNLSCNISPLDKTYYVNDADYGGDGNIYKVSSRILSIYGRLTVYKANDSEYSNFKIYLSGDGTGTKSDGETFSSQPVPNETYYSVGYGDFIGSNFTYDLNGTEDVRFSTYNTISDAINQTNGLDWGGCPIYDSIEYNASDADNIGALSNRTIKIMCSATSSKQYHVIRMESKDNSNILYQD